MGWLPQTLFKSLIGRDARALGEYALELGVIGVGYFAVAKASMALVAANPSAMAVWPPAGLALAATILRGLRVWPAILAAAWLASIPTNAIAEGAVGETLTGLLNAGGDTVAAVIGAGLLGLWSGGRRTFDSPAGVAKFGLICFDPSAMVAATAHASALCLAGQAEWANFAPLWVTWWLRDATGAFVIAPVVVLWVERGSRGFSGENLSNAAAVYSAVVAEGIAAFSPLFEQTVGRSALSFIAAPLLLWTALRSDQRTTATSALILFCFAVWGVGWDGGPFVGGGPGGAFLLLVVFATSAAGLGLATSADVARRNRLETKLHQQEQSFRAMFSQAVVGIAAADSSGHFKLVNERFCEIVRHPETELLQLAIEDLINRDDLDRVREHLIRAIDGSEGFVAETRLAPPDGSDIWMSIHVSGIADQTGTVGHLMIVAEDISGRRRAQENLRCAHEELEQRLDARSSALKRASEVLQNEVEHRKRVEAKLKEETDDRHRAQAALMESEWRFRTVVQGVSDYAMFMLNKDGYITHWNAGAQRLHGYPAIEVVGQHFGLFYTEEERQRGEPERALQVAAYEGKHCAEGQRVRRDESLFWASVVIEAVRDSVSNLVGFVSITRDITERKGAEASLERAREQLTQSQKMEALGQLTGSIAHDFNNLLMIVSGHAELLRRRLNDPKHLQAIDALHSAASRGESLTRQLLAFSRRQPLNPVLADPKERIETMREMLVGSLRGNIQLKCDIAPDIWPIEIDIAELELALVNIAINARDAMPGGGSITLSARNVSLRKLDRVDQLQGDFVAIAITDTGLGIAPDVLPKVFEPFFTTKALGKGTGLGLSQVYEFSHQSGGAVVATSAIGSGTTITIYLPRKHATLIKTEEPARVPIIAPRHGVILLVEDSPEVADVAASLIEQLGYQPLRAENATLALNRLKRGEKIDLVFSDVVMPGGMNGVALAQEIANHYPHIPVLLTSGYSDVLQAAGSRFVILRKPFQLVALDEAIRASFDRGPPGNNGDRVLHFSRWRDAAKRE